MLALVKDEKYIKKIAENTPFDVDGIYLSNAYAGWVIGDYSLHTIKPAEPLPDGKQISGTTVELDNGVWSYVNTLEDVYIPTPEELRALMPRKSMVEFRVALRSIKVVQREGETELDGIYEADILEKISLIADRALQAEARDYFLYAGYIDRSNPWVNILGGMFGLSPEQIDALWMA